MNAGQHLWLANVPLICFWIVEWHCPDRVMRQFGFDQPIPVAPIDMDWEHTQELKGKMEINWLTEQARYIRVWENSQDRVGVAPVLYGSLNHQTSEYLKWYWRVTRRWISPENAVTIFTALGLENVIERNMSRAEPDDEITDLCARMLYCMGEGGRLGRHPIHPAPPTPQFGPLQLLSERKRRRPAGFKLKWPDVELRIRQFEGRLPINPPMPPQPQSMPPEFTPAQYYMPGTPLPDFIPPGEPSSPHVSSGPTTFQAQASSSHAIGGFAQFASQSFNPFQQVGNLNVFSQHQTEHHEQFQTPPALTQQVEDDDDDNDDNDVDDVNDTDDDNNCGQVANVGEELGKGKRKKWARRCFTGGLFKGGKHKH